MDLEREFPMRVWATSADRFTPTANKRDWTRIEDSFVGFIRVHERPFAVPPHPHRWLFAGRFEAVLANS